VARRPAHSTYMLQSTIQPVDSTRWNALVARDRSAAGSFVYAVRSTGIYCRPGCASRRPRRDRVAFFDTPADAERAGYRPCRRCQPRETAAPDPWIDRIRRACAYLANVEGHLPLAALARRIGGSPYHLQRNFKRIVGITPRQYADACRLQRVKSGLRGRKSVTAATLDAGFGSSSRLYERAVPKLGMTPSTYRNGGVGVQIRFTTLESSVGRLLIAATPRGVCLVSMGRSDAELQGALGREYPAATITRDPGGLTRWARQVLDYLAGRLPRIDLPLDIQATSFQWQVWEALTAIPYGSTRTYADVAVAIGRPGAARAVARACATNPVALAIPCHRVVPAAGGPGGYRWGTTRKQALLAQERRRAPDVTSACLAEAPEARK
jgi:AraC family transcriptional regulator, regulatory protein of adaptative response / methylated-DNA-[protein]-cysteine methyltransferase